LSAKVAVHPGMCLGSKMCERRAGHLFRVIDGTAQLVSETLTDPADIDAAVDAMHGCPTGAIEVHDEQ
jgi:ferredoxin